MRRFVVPLHQTHPQDAPLIGNKAASLARLRNAGFPVPAGLCVTTEAFELAIEPVYSQIAAILAQHNLNVFGEAQSASHQIDQLLNDLRVPDAVTSVLYDQHSVYLDFSFPVAVRSSAIAEDQIDASYAGQYETILGVRGSEAIAVAIVTCWRSFFSANALAARASQGMLHDITGMAVLIQPVINAECAGVCFTVDPVTQQGDTIVISSTWGLGLGVVDGDVATDTVWIRKRSLAVAQRDIRQKHDQLTLVPDNGIAKVQVSAERQRAASLPDSWAKRIAQFGLAIERAFERPQDIEWAVADEQMWILQSRPVTALPDALTQLSAFPVQWEQPDDQSFLWTLGTEDNTDTGPLKPLEQDDLLIREAMREETCRFMGADRNQTVRFINGRLYTRPIALNITKGDFRIRRQAMNDLRDRLHRQRLTAWDYWGPEIVRATERLRAFDQDTAEGSALADHLEDAIATRRRHYMLHPMCWFDAPPAFLNALKTVTSLSSEKLEALAYQLLETGDTPLSELIDQLYALARTAASEPSIAALIQNSPPGVIHQLEALPQADDFMDKLNDLLAVYGERTGDGYGSEATIATPTWQEKPEQVFELLIPYLHNLAESPAKERARVQQLRETQLDALCQSCDDTQLVATLHSEWKYARQCAAVLELHNHYIDQMALGQLRQSVVSAARWMVSQQIIEMVEDCVWLQFDEILAALRSDTKLDYTDQVRARQRQYESWQKLDAPPILGMPDPHLPPSRTGSQCGNVSWVGNRRYRL
jgi:hypothetical protein